MTWEELLAKVGEDKDIITLPTSFSVVGITFCKNGQIAEAYDSLILTYEEMYSIIKILLCGKNRSIEFIKNMCKRNNIDINIGANDLYNFYKVYEKESNKILVECQK